MLNHHEDLSPYLYGMTFVIPEVKNIGWLDKDHPFKIGEVKPEFLSKLKKLIFNSDGGNCNILVNELRGSYECPVCGKHKLKISEEDDYFILGSAELWIPDHKIEGQYFATFGLIIHYIEEHHYQPPQDFIDSVLYLKEDISLDAQSIQDKLVRKCAGKEEA
jgi:hypothetical protein